MSFLNPVNEPVLRFSSTDASAPQINYNARVAGDVKAVLKACLVTGYGAKAGAGWSVVNEVEHVAEFVSPSAAMSDYRYKIDDTSATTTAWSYFYQGVATSVGTIGSVNKTPSSSITKASTSNRWDLLVTAQGFWFVESLYVEVLNGVAAHYTYVGRVKSALANDSSDQNIVITSFGALNKQTYGTRGDFADYMASKPMQSHLRLGQYYKQAQISHAAIEILRTYGIPAGYSSVNITDSMYLHGKNTGSGGIYAGTAWQEALELIAQMPGIKIRTVDYSYDVFDTYARSIEDMGEFLISRPGRYEGTDPLFYRNSARCELLISTDHWEY